MKIAAIQLNYTVGDFEYNYQKIKKAIIDNQKADLLIFSELSIIGYYPYDLLTYPHVVEKHNEIVQQIKQLTKIYDVAVVVGALSIVDFIKKFHNSALVIHKGEIIHQYHKQLIPSYGIFDEARNFVSGENSALVFTFKQYRFAVLICEDIWFDNHQAYLTNPVDDLAIHEIDALITLNASPSMIDKYEQRKEITSGIAKKIQAPVVYVNQVGGYDEVIYDGASFVVNQKGQIIAQAKSFEEDEFCVDLASLPIEICDRPYSDVNQLILSQLILGLQDYLAKCGFKGVVIGSSGGIDSALTIAIATLALGKDYVKAITMPSLYSSLGSVDDSIKLCQNLGVELFTREIKAEYLQTCERFEKAFRCKPKQLTRENMQARIRGRIVMEYSNDSGLLMLTTGNKSELAVGYATLYGDMCGALNCIGDLYKQDVYALSNYINKVYGELIPQRIIDKAPSAELAEGQKDSDSLPEYYYLDAMLKLYLEKDLLLVKEIGALQKIVDKVPRAEQQRIYKLVSRAEFKRKQAPQILYVQRRPFGMGRRIPVTARL